MRCVYTLETSDRKFPETMLAKYFDGLKMFVVARKQKSPRTIWFRDVEMHTAVC